MQLRLRLDAKRRKFDRTKSRPPQLSAKVLMKSETQTTWSFCEGIHTALPSHCILYIQNHTKRGWALCIVIFVDGSIVDSDIYVSQVAFLWSLFSGLFFSFSYWIIYILYWVHKSAKEVTSQGLYILAELIGYWQIQ